MDFYISVFNDSRIVRITRYGEEGPGAPGTVMTASFELTGQEFTALNGGPVFTFSQAISFVVKCETQEEVDMFWEKLSEGGEKQECGWLKDRYGVSWQIVPSEFLEMMNDTDPVRSRRVMQAMLQMGKLDIAILRQAYESE
jgi:predicted 3-demethylubiquinone-9 3-methyltransferase (glyoxalase superfamily)